MFGVELFHEFLLANWITFFPRVFVVLPHFCSSPFRFDIEFNSFIPAAHFTLVMTLAIQRNLCRTHSKYFRSSIILHALTIELLSLFSLLMTRLCALLDQTLKPNSLSCECCFFLSLLQFFWKRFIILLDICVIVVCLRRQRNVFMKPYSRRSVRDNTEQLPFRFDSNSHMEIHSPTHATHGILINSFALRFECCFVLSLFSILFLPFLLTAQLDNWLFFFIFFFFISFERVSRSAPLHCELRLSRQRWQIELLCVCHAIA